MEISGGSELPSAVGVDPDEFLAPSQAALEAGVSRQTVYDWIRRGHLTAEMIAGVKRVRRGDVRRLAGVRRVAEGANLRIATVRHWADSD